MLIDATEFPIVRVDFAAQQPLSDADRFEADSQAFSQLFERGAPFVLLSRGSYGGGDAPRPDRESMKQSSLWMKKNKPLLKLVLAMIVVEPSASKRLAGKAFAGFFQKFWGYPMLLAASEEEALTTAQRLLAGESLP